MTVTSEKVHPVAWDSLKAHPADFLYFQRMPDDDHLLLEHAASLREQSRNLVEEARLLRLMAQREREACRKDRETLRQLRFRRAGYPAK